MPRDTNVLIKIIVDFFILLIVGIPILIFHLHGQPTKRGYYCDDDSIRYPFRESTISNNVLYVVGLFLPIVIIIITEFANESKGKRDTRGQVTVLFGRQIPRVIWKIYIKIGVFLFGACMSQLTTDIAKYSIGRLRPHFLHVCNSSIRCNEAGQDPHIYIENFECLGQDLNKIREARLSFPSGHSSFSAYTMVYTVIYLQANMKCKTNKLLKPFIQFILLMMTWYTALSRIADFKHHWSDVLVGFLQGVIVALITAYCVSDFFTKNKGKSEDMTLQNMSDSPVTNYNTMSTDADVLPR
jgi:phosphatidate phosphatase